MKKLIVSGCSWCDDNFISVFHPELKCSWPKWPEILSKKLGMECINLAKCGAGSEYIYNSLLEAVAHTNDIGLVIASWSKPERRDWQRPNKIWTHESTDIRGTNVYWIERHIRYYYSFQLLCEYFQVPYKQVQMLTLNPRSYTFNKDKKDRDDIRKNTLLTFGTNPMIDLIDENNFIGWPLLEELGGSNIDNNVIKKYKDKRFQISNEDSHPNAEGHKLIADYMYENI